MKYQTTFVLFFACAVAGFHVSLNATVAADDDHAKVEFFESNIRPVLVEHCYKCHSQQAKNVRGGLLLDSQAGVAQGGESGPAIVSGKPEDSLLLSSLKHESYEMPPDRKLPDNVIADFEKWITDGAIDPRAGGKTLVRESIDLEAGRNFWCFQPVTKPEIPTATDVAWSRTPIDRFIAARHRQNNVSPVQDASPEQIVRRLYFTLIGLPPNIAQISEFVDAWKIDSDKAIADTADLLLASPRFGERWGRHWLDATRFAESSGGGRSLMFKDAWRFRDYVIQSFNNDKPFDQLIREHIAGDLLPSTSAAQFDDQVTGVGYLTLGPTNYEQQDKELLRMEVVDEQVDTIGRTFLAMTLGCARCHDHKFDPVPTSDYYAMAGIFRSTKTLTPGNVSGYVTTPMKATNNANELAEWTAAEQILLGEIKLLQKPVKRAIGKPKKAIDPASLPGLIVDDTEAIFEGTWVDSVFVAPFIGKGYRHDMSMKAGRKVTFKVQLPKSGNYQVRLCHNYSPDRCSSLPVEIQHAAGSNTVTIDQRKTPLDAVFADLGMYAFSKDQAAVVTIDVEKSGPGVVIIDALQFLPATDEASAESERGDQRQLAKKLTQLEKRLQLWQGQKPAVAEAMSVRDQDEPGDWHIHVRGGIRNLGDIIPRGFMSVASTATQSSAEKPLIPANQSGRLQLAAWIASETNPLTSRVYVNRVWLHLLGEGLVRTPDNFGKMGQLPTHSELLDYLAATFVAEHQWSTKQLIRSIVTSRVFRLSSTAPAELVDADSGNLLLTRAFRKRLEAEAIRDSVLQINGQLNLKTTSGLTIENVTIYDNGYDHEAKDANLRSVYVPFFRNSMPEMFVVFDVANPNLVTGRRAESTLPTQALFLLNSPYILKQSRLAAQHFLSTHTADPANADPMISQGWQMTVGRVPFAEERNVVQALLEQHGTDSEDAWTAIFQSLFASMDFRYLD